MFPDNIKIFLLRVLVSPALIGAIFLLLGILLSNFPPKSINMFSGYRTRRSMLNQDTWTEANRYVLILMIRLGKGCLFLGILCGLLIPNLIVISIVTVVITIIVAVLLLWLTEKRLNALFDEAGNKRNMS